ncbi:hypothetical protein HLI18_33390 [Rhizobium laguerreae]|nr:hypothetical protein [Rhizobium laguerreae]NNG74644.1 hypothetical protein [Rhizobium laguerreae]
MAALRRKEAIFVKRLKKWRNGKADYAEWGATGKATPKRVNATRGN